MIDLNSFPRLHQLFDFLNVKPKKGPCNSGGKGSVMK